MSDLDYENFSAHLFVFRNSFLFCDQVCDLAIMSMKLEIL